MDKRRTLFIVALLALAIFAQAPVAHSQGTLGTVTNVGQSETCPSRGFIAGVGMQCYPATLSSCPGNADMQFVYGVAPPATGTTPLGTIVFFGRVAHALISF
jgi:hypothetical protein